jgi:hypothetical protein
MMTEEQLSEANGLVAHFYRAKKAAAPHEALFAIQCRLLVLGVQLRQPVEAPDPTAPPGGSALALKVA